jgi:hypothetical protein
MCKDFWFPCSSVGTRQNHYVLTTTKDTKDVKIKKKCLVFFVVKEYFLWLRQAAGKQNLKCVIYEI